MISTDRLKELVNYNPETGVFTRRAAVRSHPAGKILNCKATDRNGTYYLQASFDGRLYMLHRCAWLYMTGNWPKFQIDHINCDKTDNRWCNLREATHAQNVHNRTANKRSRSGIKGVSRFGDRWRARLSVGGTVAKHLGVFDTAQEAAAVYAKAHKALYGEFSRV